MPIELIFATSFVIGLTGAMMPGPLLTLAVAESARHGFRAGPLLILGHGLLEAALIMALTAGLAAVLVRTEVTAFIAVVGGGFLIWMGYCIARDALRGRVQLAVAAGGKPGSVAATIHAERAGTATVGAAKTGTADGNAAMAASVTIPETRAVTVPGTQAGAASGTRYAPRLVGLGIATSLANPYFILWWATIGLGYITLSLERGPAGLAAFFSGHVMADLAWYSLVAAAVAGSGRFLTPRIYRGILAVCGFFLVTLGGYFIWSGLVINRWLG
ncbi:MAG: LysE family transporter [Bacillota bacterium]|jgi:threonine/homoserine/homoserine lactone efflux protein